MILLSFFLYQILFHYCFDLNKTRPAKDNNRKPMPSPKSMKIEARREVSKFICFIRESASKT